jgi:diaminopimelate decarboxylase
MPEVRRGRQRRGDVGESVLTRDDVAGESGTGERALLSRIADATGTPTYVYDAARIRTQYQRLSGVLQSVPHRVHYSAKANSSGAVLRLLQELGAGVDIVSGGELVRATRAGFAGSDIVFSGVGKGDSELRAALEADILFFNVESLDELLRLNALAMETGRPARVALRVNPEVTVDTPHPYTRTGERGMKFGIPVDEALHAAEVAEALPMVRLVGLDMHLGSQISDPAPWKHGLEKLLELLDRCREAGARDIAWLDIGGGFAVTYERERPTDLEAWADAVLPLVRDTGLQLVVEPGRWLVADAGVLLARVLYRKRSGGREFVILDAGMTELIRPALYNAYHEVDVVTERGGSLVADLVGPVCESGDFLAIDREITEVQAGDLVAVRCTGAYGYAMSSNYNSRPRPAEVMMDDGRFATITRRETVEDMMGREQADPEWRTH